MKGSFDPSVQEDLNNITKGVDRPETLLPITTIGTAIYPPETVRPIPIGTAIHPETTLAGMSKRSTAGAASSNQVTLPLVGGVLAAIGLVAY